MLQCMDRSHMGLERFQKQRESMHKQHLPTVFGAEKFHQYLYAHGLKTDHWQPGCCRLQNVGSVNSPTLQCMHCPDFRNCHFKPAHKLFNKYMNFTARPTQSFYRIMWALHAKQVILQIAASLRKLQQLVLIEDGPVHVRHYSMWDVCTCPLQDVQDLRSGGFISTRVDNQRSTWVPGRKRNFEMRTSHLQRRWSYFTCFLLS